MFNSFLKRTIYKNRYLVRDSSKIKTKIFPASKNIKIFLKDKDEFISLEEIAFDIWSLLNKKILFEDLIKKLEKEYYVSKKTLEKDVVQFIIELEKYHLVKILDK